MCFSPKCCCTEDLRFSSKNIYRKLSIEWGFIGEVTYILPYSLLLCMCVSVLFSRHIEEVLVKLP
jgi:hypothetical protein